MLHPDIAQIGRQIDSVIPARPVCDPPVAPCVIGCCPPKHSDAVSKSPPSVPADDVESGLRDLIRDLRPTKVGGEEPQKRETQHTEMRSRQARWHGMVFQRATKLDRS